jgi:hypothetical protein
MERLSLSHRAGVGAAASPSRDQHRHGYPGGKILLISLRRPGSRCGEPEHRIDAGCLRGQLAEIGSQGTAGVFGLDSWTIHRGAPRSPPSLSACPRTITSGGSPVARVSHGDRRQRDAGGVFAETASGSIGDRSCSAGPRPGLAGGRSAAGSGKRPKSAQRSSVAPGPPVRAVRSACISSTTRIQEMLSRWPHRQPDTQGTGQPAHCD